MKGLCGVVPICRCQSGDSGGSNLRRTDYTANNLNQYTARNAQGPDQADIIGMAYATASVTVNGNAAYRKGEYYHFALGLNNATAPVWRTVTATATQGNSTESTTGELLAPPAAQSFQYDADGNLTFDGIWVYEWDGENRLIAMTMTNTIANLANSNRLRLDFAYDLQGRRIVSGKTGA